MNARLASFPSGRLATVIVALPLALVVVVGGFFAAGVTTAAFGVFFPAVTIPLGVVLAAGGLLLVPRDRPSGWGPVLGAIAVLLIVIAWTVVQFLYPTEFVRPNRDPGLYFVSGVWLAQHGTASIDISAAQALIAGNPAFTAALGFEYEPDLAIHLQGGDGAPSIVGLGYWIAGIEGALRANLAVAAIALLAVYELARRVIPRTAFALVPVLLLAASMPFSYFSRAPYTEIATTAFFAAGVALLVAAFRGGRPRDFVLAGALSGIACLTRIDTTLPFAMLVASFALIGFGFGRMPEGLRLSAAFWRFMVPGGAFLLIGIADVVLNYRRYLGDLGNQVTALWVLIALVTVVALVAVVVHDRRPAWQMSDTAARRWWLGASIGVVALMLFWVSRPAWLISHFTSKPAYQAHVVDLQGAAGQVVDPTRSYDEYSLWWFAWYFGWALLAAVTVGFVLVARRVFVDRDAGMLVFAVLTLGTALLYVTKISIAPDQLWAFRRVLPVITPGFLIVAGLLAAWLWDRRRLIARIAAVVLVLVLGLGTRMAWTAPMFVQAEFRGQLPETQQVCALVDDREVVVAAGVSSGFGLTIHALCDVDVVTLEAETPEAAEQALAELVGTGVDAVLVTERPETLVWSGEVPSATVVEEILRWDNVLFGAPARVGVSPRSTWVADVAPDGTLSPTEARG